MYSIGTFGVQNFSIINATNGLCCRCSFITGNYVKGCYIQYNCTQTVFNGHLNITVSEQEQCVEDIYTSVYNITVYDIENDGTVRMDQPVFEFSNISVYIPDPSASTNTPTPANTPITPDPNASTYTPTPDPTDSTKSESIIHF